MGDGTVLSRHAPHAHHRFPTVPMLAVAKEISLEDVRLGLEKMPDRFVEHPPTVLVITNLNYADAPRLMLRDPQLAAALNWQEVPLEGNSSHDYEEQIEELGPIAGFGLGDEPEREDRQSHLPAPLGAGRLPRRPQVPARQRDPRPGPAAEAYDFVLASQPWRARMSAEFKVGKVLAPLTRSLAPGGRLLAIQSAGRDPALEIVREAVARRESVPGRPPRAAVGAEARTGPRRARLPAQRPADDKAIFRYEMHTLPSEISDRIGTSTLFAAWNAAIYVNQIEDERLEAVVRAGRT